MADVGEAASDENALHVTEPVKRKSSAGAAAAREPPITNKAGGPRKRGK